MHMPYMHIRHISAYILYETEISGGPILNNGAYDVFYDDDICISPRAGSFTARRRANSIIVEITSTNHRAPDKSQGWRSSSSAPSGT